MSNKAQNVVERFRQMTRTQSAGWWTAIGALLAMGAVPCPECGGPMVLHTWPLAGLLILARALKRRKSRGQQAMQNTAPDPAAGTSSNGVEEKTEA